MSTTATMLIEDGDLSLQVRADPAGHGYHWFRQRNSPDESFPAGIEAEVGECLYGLVAMTKPDRIVETGTRLGISTRYMARALHDWHPEGRILTFERCGQCAAFARTRLKRFQTVTVEEADTRSVDLKDPIDFLYLDSEPEYRYRELDRWWPLIRDRALIVIHDLNRLDCTPFMPLPPWFYAKWVAHRLQAMTFQNSTGLTILQKHPDLWNANKT